MDVQKKIVLATGLFPPALGGHAKYAEAIDRGLRERGVQSTVVAYSALPKGLPPGIRHLVYFWRVLKASRDADWILAFDTWSTGLPSVLVSKVTGVPVAIRIGGDFLWEAYVERSGNLVKLSEFYEAHRPLTRKEKIIFSGTRWLLRHADLLLFNSDWLRVIWRSAYVLEEKKTAILENVFPPKTDWSPSSGRVFISAGRDVKLKQSGMLKRIFEILQKKYPDISLDTRTLGFKEHEERMRGCYAVLLPSVSEVNPNVIIEAISHGKPFVCTSDTGLNQHVKRVGMHVDAQDEIEFTKAVERLFDPTVYETEVQKLKAFTYARTWDDVTNDLLSKLQEATHD